jgi:hypothetical protein
LGTPNLALGESVAVEPLGAVPIKGKAVPVEVFAAGPKPDA